MSAQGLSLRIGSLCFVALALVFGAHSATFAHGDEDHSKKPTTPSSANKAKPSASMLDATAAQRLSDGSLFVPKMAQRQMGLRTMLSEVRNLPQTWELNGIVLADPNAGGRVQASQAGRIEAGQHGLPSLGQRVSKGQVLAYLRPVMTSLDRGNSQSILADIDSQLSITEAKLRRYESLADALPKATIETARYDVDALKKRKSAVEASLSKSEALIAPVSGVISVANAITGQVVDAKETLFEIIDPQRLMVEALAYDPILTSDIASATASFNSPVEINQALALSLSFVGGGQQMREQAIPLLFRLKQAQRSLAVGQTLKVIVQSKHQVSGVSVPRSAVIRLTNGETIVWVHTQAERFEIRKVKALSLDAATMSLLEGVKEDERVVILGTSLLAQVR